MAQFGYKVVNQYGESVLALMMTCRNYYPRGAWIQATETLDMLGYWPCYFRRLKDAAAWKYNMEQLNTEEPLKLYHCEIRKTKQARGMKCLWGMITIERIKRAMEGEKCISLCVWPTGTRMARQIKLLEEVRV